jgi:hypothetical protein
MAREQITIAEDSFTIALPTQTETVRLDTVTAVVLYKRDLLTIDLICCDIFTEDLVHTVHEELTGFDNLISRLEKLPGFDREWRERVFFPAFAENRTTVFQRAN